MRLNKTVFVIILLVMAVTLSVAALPSVAQDDADEHNPCLNGTWYCPDPEDPAREEWNWTCGWYWAHFSNAEYGQAQIPSWCLWPDGYCQVDLASFGFTSVDGIHGSGGFDIWTSYPGMFVEWTPFNQNLPACSITLSPVVN